MAGSPSDDSGVGGSSNGISSGQRCQSGEALAEWRSSEQVENGTPSTSPPYWDTDDDDDDRGPKPSELYGKFTWKIENFSQITKRELRSNAFEVGGYKWYILIYPQGCDVCNHLSLFLCVANHDKLLPGWSHFAQFTIAVVNKDPKKSKYSDTLHKFWKKEHDWGWKKFMELSKVFDGFVVTDTLVIKAQVQVIREKSHRPFRCLDCQYRRELVRVYLTNVEQICRRFVEERRGKLGKLIEDKARWTSFCNFWKKVEKGAKRSMSREKTDVILKVVVKHFFIEKEVTSTLVMDSLYSGLKALESQSKSKEGAKSLDTEETPDPIVCVEQDMFVLAGDVLSLITRAALEPLPPKDEKGPQNRTKDGNSGDDLNKDSIERDERRLTELGRRSVEIFVLAHIFSNKIEVAHQEAVALEKQEELIREEEAAWQAESEQKTRRGASEKEKRAKKKQSKQRRSRKGKDKGRDEKFDAEVQDKKQHEGSIDLGTLSDLSVKQVLTTLEKSEALDDVSDVSFNGDDNSEALQPCVEDRDASSLNSDTDTSEVHQIDAADVFPATEVDSRLCGLPVQNGQSSKKTNSVMDDSSSTCSTDSVPSVAALNGSYKMNLMPSYKGQISPSRGKKQRGTGRRDQTGGAPDIDNRLSEPVLDIARLRDTSGSCRATEPELEVDAISMDYQIQRIERHMDQKKEEETVVVPQKKMTMDDDVQQDEVPSKKMAEEASSFVSSALASTMQQPKSVVHSAPSPAETSLKSSSLQETEKKVPLNIASPQIPVISKLDAQRPLAVAVAVSKPTVSNHQLVSGMSRPSSTPLTSTPRPNTPPQAVVVSVVQTSTPMLSRSVSATGRLGIDSSSSQSYAPSYRNAIMGKTMGAGFTPFPSTCNSPSPMYPQALSTPLSMLSPQRLEDDQSSSMVRPGGGFTFGSVTPEILQNRPPQWLDYPHHDSNMTFQHQHQHQHQQPSPSELNGIGSFDSSRYGSSSSTSSTSGSSYLDGLASGSNTRQQAQGGMLPEEFPHLDIINYLLDEEHSSLIGKGSKASTPWSSSYSGSNPLRHTSTNHHHHPLHRQFSFPGEMASSEVSASASNYRSRFDYPLHLDNYHHENGGGGVMHHPMLYGGGGGGSYNNNSGSLRDMVSPPMSVYGNGHITDGMSQNHWQYNAPDISLLSLRNNNETDGSYSSYQHQLPEYSNLVTGYTSAYRPSNGR